MKEFLDDNFLLNSEVAVELYEKYGKDMPIFDFHCHLSPEEIAKDKKFKNITDIWLGGDHYKWRAMRSNGIEERLITGDASDYDKFKAWAKTVPYTIGNPLYHWSHLELRRYFDIDLIINETTADEIWKKTNAMLETKEFTARELIKRSNVKALCTTDDAIDTLEYHKMIREDESFDVKVLPALRPDKGINIEMDTFIPWIEALEGVSNREIKSYDEFIKVLDDRVQFFHDNGSRLSDHGIDKIFYEEATDEEVNEIFKKALRGEELSQIEIDKYKTKTLLNLGKMYNKRDWVMQIHLGALRNNNTRMFEELGADTGFDSINDGNIAEHLSNLLDQLDKTNELPKTILFCLNPSDNDIIGTMIGNFQGGGIPGKVQFGSGWWFNDQKDGMEKQMTALANLGLLRRFVGMVTDSRSFLSYIRHEYFRRTLCNLIGTWVVEGEVPYDMELLGSMIEEICYDNALEYLNIKL
ncbi:MAG TPA: glucuronate isomerase [Tissierellales bacterium]|nr:glucuronate isomerase [Tissierellales bacterium]